MLDTIIRFHNGISVPNTLLDKASKSAIVAIKNELPEEAQVYGVLYEVLERCKQELDSKKIVL